MSSPNFDRLESQLFSAWAFGPDGNWRPEHSLGYWKPRLANHAISEGLEDAAWSIANWGDKPQLAMEKFCAHGDFPVVMRIENINANGDTGEVAVVVPWQAVFAAWADDDHAMTRADAYALTHDAYGREKNLNPPSMGEILADAMGFGHR